MFLTEVDFQCLPLQAIEISKYTHDFHSRMFYSLLSFCKNISNSHSQFMRSQDFNNNAFKIVPFQFKVCLCHVFEFESLLQYSV